MKKHIYLSISIVALCAIFLWSAYFINVTQKQTSLPKPTGLYSVGVTTYQLIDHDREERHSHGSKRELVIDVWYPAEASAKQTPRLYFSKGSQILKEDVSAMSTLSQSKLAHLDTLRAYAVENAPISSEDPTYPIVIFSPGFGAPCQLYTSLLEDLASHGYIVIGINHPYVSNPTVFPDGRIVKQASLFSSINDEQCKKIEKDKERETWLADTIFVINELEKINTENHYQLLNHKLDRTKIGIFGHSFGGTVALEAGLTDSRCSVVVDIEGKLGKNISEDFPKPVMFILAHHAPEEVHPFITLINKLKADACCIQIETADHGSFGDFYCLTGIPKKDIMDSHQAISITRSLLADFFDAYLKRTGLKPLHFKEKMNPKINMICNNNP